MTLSKVRRHKREPANYGIFYHVTRMRNLPTIQKLGLMTSFPKNVRISKRGYTYLFSDLIDAGGFADEMLYKAQEPVVILTVKANKDKIQQDTNTGATVGRWWITSEDIPPERVTHYEVFEYGNKFRDWWMDANDKRWKAGLNSEMVVATQ